MNSIRDWNFKILIVGNKQLQKMTKKAWQAGIWPISTSTKQKSRNNLVASCHESFREFQLRMVRPNRGDIQSVALLLSANSIGIGDCVAAESGSLGLGQGSRVLRLAETGPEGSP